MKTPTKGRTGVRVMFYIAPELDDFIERVRNGKSRSKWLRELIAEKYKRPDLLKMLEVGRRKIDVPVTNGHGRKNGRRDA